ncbi:MAG: SDR family oxidoreductase [Streptococcaceae bacterium]|jgi:dTDP-4-dehydrorhamnose reductase|nr:SDR family oxidoreductase [Streptococcaceae bacterium]
MFKVLVLGSNGMAGHVIVLYLKEQGHDVYGFARNATKVLDQYYIEDVKNFSYLKQNINEQGFGFIINAVGLLNQFADVNKDQAVLINSYLPQYLKQLTQNMNAKIIQISTDCVFSGKKGGYKVDDLRDGESFYDLSKILGEIDDDKNLTFRTSIVGPDIKKEGIGLFNWFMKQEGTIKGYNRVYWSGITTITLAKAIDKAIKCGLTGIYQLTNNEKISKYELLKLFNEYFKDNNISILKDNTIQSDKSLINERKDFNFIVPSYRDMVEEMHEWILSHNIYNYRLEV